MKQLRILIVEDEPLVAMLEILVHRFHETDELRGILFGGDAL